MEAIKEFLSISSGDGYGDGSGDGYGDGSGSGDGIAEYNGAAVYSIDGVQTLIASVRGNIARGHIVNSDLSLTPCYICKIENSFAHGSSLREARNAALEKIFDDKPESERIAAFVRDHTPGVEYPNADFFSWHHRLTGSCKMGREQFANDHGIDVEHGSMTPEAFIRLTQDAFGGGIIRKLIEYYPAADTPG